MIKFAVLNDLHFADNSPIGRKTGYADQLFAKLSGVAEVMQKADADTLIITGDVFHTKRPDRNSFSLVNRLAEALHNDFGSVYICPGNHDLSADGIDSLYRQPLGMFFTTEIARPLIKGDNWQHIRAGKVSALFLGRHYDTDGDLDPSYYPITKDEERLASDLNSNVCIMVAHGSIVPSEGAPVYDHVNVNKIPWEDGGFAPDLLLCGHLHEDWGIEKTSGGPIYVNLGSFGRPSRNQLGVDTRNFLMVTIGDDLKIKLEQIPIPNMLPASEVFLEKTEDVDDEALSEFAEQLADSLVLEETSIDEALDALGDIPPKVKARLRKYLEEAGI